MTLTDKEITDFIKQDKGLSTILHPIGNMYIPSDLDNMQLLLLSIYIRLMLRGTYVTEYYNLSEVKQVYAYLGGDYDGFNLTFIHAKSEGLVGSRYSWEQSQNAEVPTISGNKGYNELQEIMGRMSEGRSRLIVAGTKFSSRMNFVEFLDQLNVTHGLRVSDTYIDSMTLFPFASMNVKPKNIRVLTENLKEDVNTFKTNASEFIKETKVNLEIKKTNSIHDRYIISDDEAWSIGASIKDLGNKDTIISQTENVRESLADLFELRWKSATEI